MEIYKVKLKAIILSAAAGDVVSTVVDVQIQVKIYDHVQNSLIFAQDNLPTSISSNLA